MDKMDTVHSQSSKYSKLRTWLTDVSVIFTAIILIILLIAMYRAYQDESLNDAIANASNGYGPLMVSVHRGILTYHA